MKSLKNIAALVVLVLVIIVVAQNTEPVETRILMATVSMPRALLLMCTLAAGLLAGWALGAHKRSQRAKPE